MLVQSTTVTSSVSLITNQLSISDAICYDSPLTMHAFSVTCPFCYIYQQSVYTLNIVSQQKPAKHDQIQNAALLVIRPSALMTPLSGVII